MKFILKTVMKPIFYTLVFIDVTSAIAQESSPPLATDETINYPLDDQNYANQKWISHVVFHPTASQKFYALSLLQIDRTERNYLVPMDPSGTMDTPVTITIDDAKNEQKLSIGSKK